MRGGVKGASAHRPGFPTTTQPPCALVVVGLFCVVVWVGAVVYGKPKVRQGDDAFFVVLRRRMWCWSFACDRPSHATAALPALRGGIVFSTSMTVDAYQVAVTEPPRVWSQMWARNRSHIRERRILDLLPHPRLAASFTRQIEHHWTHKQLRTSSSKIASSSCGCSMKIMGLRMEKREASS